MTIPLQCSDGQVTIRDVHPANPSFVNDLPASERRLAHGDRSRIGSSTFVLTVGGVATDPVHVGEDRAEQRSIADADLVVFLRVVRRLQRDFWA